MCGGKDRFRFDDKDGRGTYYCSGCGAGDGVKLAMALTSQGFRETALQIERLAGVVQPVAGKPERTDEDRLAALRRVWSESKPIQRGDEAERYLLGRGLRLYDLPESIRVHLGLRYQDGDTVGTYAAMLATVTGPDGRAVSLHRTYLQNASKAPVLHPKKLMQGLPLSGAAIRLTPVSQVLGISEGIETALAASELFEVPVWSCVSAQGIESFEPPAGVEHVIVFADNDANFAGQAAAYRAAHRLKLKGFEVEVVAPPTVGDWLDELLRRRTGEGI
jgi:putative DNA primase/helicase